MECKEHLMAAITYFEKDVCGYTTIDKLQKACIESNIEAVLPEDMVLEADQNIVSLPSESLLSFMRIVISNNTTE